MRSVRIFYACLGLSFLALAGCSDSGNNSPQPQGEKGNLQKDGGNQPLKDGTILNPTCNCNWDQVCDATGKCIAKPEPTLEEVQGEAVLDRYMDPSRTDVTGHFARGEAKFFKKATPPTDTRDKFQTDNGETCYFENNSGCCYPSWWNDQLWILPGLNAGKLTYTIQGAQGPVVYETFNSDKPGDPNPTGWIYFHGDTPPPIQEGSSTYADWFDENYLPFDAPFQMSMAGGSDFKAESFTGLKLPKAFDITNPPVGSDVSMDHDLKISWTPAEEGASMYIEIWGPIGMDNWVGLRCTVRDDGEVTIPQAAVGKLGLVSGIQMQRNVTRYRKTTTLDGKNAHLYLTGRYTNVRRWGSY
jgi:hypothetical protein